MVKTASNACPASAGSYRFDASKTARPPGEAAPITATTGQIEPEWRHLGAKLAARNAAEHGARNVALVTTDTARIGGREQLYSYGRQLGVAVHEADSDAARRADLADSASRRVTAALAEVLG